MSQNTLRKVMIFGAAFGALWLTVRYLLPIFLPFLLALAIVLAAEPLVRFFTGRLRFPRIAATGIGVSITLILLVLLITVLGALLLKQLGALVNVLPDLEGTATQGVQVLQTRLTSLAESAPDSIRPMATRCVEGLFSDGTAVMENITQFLLGLASGIVTRLPDSALGIGTWILASFMLSAKLPQLKSRLARRMPPSWHEKYLPTLRRLKKAVLGWLGAQLRLAGVTFGVLTAGFLLLRITYAPLWAALISLVDALPVLGTGTVLIPWSIICFLQNDYIRGLGLLGIYGVAWLLRSVLEPRLIGKQLGLDPLITLVCMYTGYRLWGIPGMLFSPLLAVTILQFFHSENASS